MNRDKTSAFLIAATLIGALSLVFYGRTVRGLGTALVAVSLLSLLSFAEGRSREDSGVFDIPKGLRSVLRLVPIIGLIVVSLFLSLVNTPSPPSPGFFLISLVLMAVSGGVIIMTLKDVDSHLYAISATLPFSVALSLVPALTAPAVLFGYDTSSSLFSANAVIHSGWPIQGAVATPVDIYVSQYPILSFLSAMLSTFTGVPTLAIAKVLPTLFIVITSVFLYLSVFELFENKQAAAITSFAFAGSSSILFNTWYVNQSMAMPMAIAAIYCFVRFEKKKSRSLLATGIMLSVGVVLAHDLTPIFLLTLLMGSYVVWLIYRASGAQNVAPVISKFRVIVLITSMVSIYGVYVGIIFASTVGALAINLLHFGLGGLAVRKSTGGTLQDEASQLLAIGSLILVCGISAYGIIRTKKRYRVGTTALLLVSIFFVLLSQASARIPNATSLPWERAGIYSLTLAIPPFVMALLSLKLPRKSAVLLAATIMILSIQIYGIHPDYYDRTLLNSHSYPDNKVYFLPTEVAATTWLKSPAPVVGDQTVYGVANGFNPRLNFSADQTTVGVFYANFSGIPSGTNFFVFLKDYTRSPSYKLSWFPVIPVVNETQIIIFGNLPRIQTVYANSGASVYEIG